jgi:hypothetical protein
MMNVKATVTVKMFTMPNYLKLEGPIVDSTGIDVGALFPADADAALFWDECRRKWVDHVAKRRIALGKESAP